MAEQLDLNSYQTVNRVPGAPGVLEATPKDGSESVRINENLLLDSEDLAYRKGYNAAAQDLGHEVPPDSWPEAEIPQERRGVWHTKYDGDKDVTIVGEGEPIEAEGGRETYLTSDGINIPKDEVDFIDEAPEPSPQTNEPTPEAPALSPEVEEAEALKEEIAALRQQLEQQAALIEELKNQMSAQTKLISELREQLQEGGEQNKSENIQRTRIPPEEVPNVSEFPIGIRVSVEDKNGQTKDNWRIAGKPERHKGKWEILLTNIEGRLIRVSPEDLRKWNKNGIETTRSEEEAVQSQSAAPESAQPSREHVQQLQAEEAPQAKRFKRAWKRAKQKITDLRTKNPETQTGNMSREEKDSDEEKKKKLREAMAQAIAALTSYKATELKYIRALSKSKEPKEASRQANDETEVMT